LKVHIEPTDRNAWLLGECLRDLFFDQDGGHTGCYSTFTLRKNIIELPSEKEEFYPYKEPDEVDTIVWHRAKLVDAGMVILMRYYWDGDGTLEFDVRTPEEHFVLENTDCKKVYMWKLEHVLSE